MPCEPVTWVTETREWATLVLVVIGAVIAWRTYVASLRQQRLENSFKMLELFKSNLDASDLEVWKEIFQGSYEGTGVGPNEFWLGGQKYPFDDLFSEGPPDNGAVSRILDQLELMSLEAANRSIELRIIYSNLGQLMHHVYGMVQDDPNGGFAFACPNFLKLMKTQKAKFDQWTYRTIIHSE